MTNRISNNTELCVYFIFICVFFFFFLTHKYWNKHTGINGRNLTHNSHNSETEGGLREASPLTHNSTQFTQFEPAGVAGWQGYVYDLCLIRDRQLFYEPDHPVFLALDKVSPRMSAADEAFVREVILEYAPKSARRDGRQVAR